MNKILPYGQHAIDEEDIECVIKILKTSQITQGETVEQFGKLLAKYAGARCRFVLFFSPQNVWSNWSRCIVWKRRYFE